MDFLSRSKRTRRRSTVLHKPSFERDQTDYSSDSACSMSSPMSSVFSTPHHSRDLSASSSFESSPTLDQTEFSTPKRVGPGGLPDLQEDPAELDTPFECPPSPVSPHASQFPQSVHDAPRSSYQQHSRYSRRYEDYSDLSDDEPFFGKRRCSAEQNRTSFVDGVRGTLGSFSKRSRHLKRSSTASAFRAASLPPSPSPSPLHRSRDPSRNRTRTSEEEEVKAEYCQGVPGLETIFSSANFDQRMTYLGYLQPDSPTTILEDHEPTRSSTPLLPRFMGTDEPVEIFQSPLQSPTVVPATFSNITSAYNSPVFTPEYSSPTPSRKPSTASLHRYHASHVTPSSDIPPLVISDPNDEWAEKLGHSNFTITPRPYLPQICDLSSCQQLLNDWEQARTDYAKHRCRTEVTYGACSKVFKLTEQKWATIDAHWKSNSDIAANRAAESGALEFPSSSAEPAPVARIPQIDDPRIVQGEEIVGPMKVEPVKVSPPAPIRRSSSKRESLLRIFTPNRPSRAFSLSRTTADF